MISWKLKKIVLRNIKKYSVKNQCRHTGIQFFVVAILANDSEKMLFEFGSFGNEEQINSLITQSKEICNNNAIAMIYNTKTENIPRIIKDFAYAKMKIFSDVDIEWDEDTIVLPFGKHIGMNINKVPKAYVSYTLREMSEKFLPQYPTLFDRINKMDMCKQSWKTRARIR